MDLPNESRGGKGMKKEKNTFNIWKGKKAERVAEIYKMGQIESK